MKLKLILAIGLFMSAFEAGDARADNSCVLTVNGGDYAYIWRGQFFTYEINISLQPLPGPGPQPPGPPVPQFTIRFVGPDINGFETYPGLFPPGYSVLTGYQNPPSGGATGYYQRQALVFNNLGFFVCETNVVVVGLQ